MIYTTNAAIKSNNLLFYKLFNFIPKIPKKQWTTLISTQLILCDLALPSYLNYCTRDTWHVKEENRIILLSFCHSIMIKGLLNGKYKRSECRVKVYTLNSLLLTVLLQRLWVSSKKFCIDLSFIIYQIVMNKSRSLMAFPD